MPNIVHGILVPGRADGGPEFVWYDLADDAAERVRACTVDGVHGGHQRDWREFLDVQSVDEPLHSIIEGRASVVTWTTVAPPTVTSIDAWLVLRGTGGASGVVAGGAGGGAGGGSGGSGGSGGAGGAPVPGVEAPAARGDGESLEALDSFLDEMGMASRGIKRGPSGQLRVDDFFKSPRLGGGGGATTAAVVVGSRFTWKLVSAREGRRRSIVVAVCRLRRSRC